MLEGWIESQIPDRNRELVVYCAVGGRSAFAVESLRQLGYLKAVSMDGGFEAWKSLGLPWVIDPLAGRRWKAPRSSSAGSTLTCR